MKDYYGRELKVGDKVRVMPIRGAGISPLAGWGWYTITKIARTRVHFDYQPDWKMSAPPECVILTERDGMHIDKDDLCGQDPIDAFQAKMREELIATGKWS